MIVEKEQQQNLESQRGEVDERAEKVEKKAGQVVLKTAQVVLNVEVASKGVVDEEEEVGLQQSEAEWVAKTILIGSAV